MENLTTFAERPEIDQALATLRPLLSRYLQSKGINAEPGKNFSCFMPGHKDDRPSCNIGTEENQEIYYCHGCHAAGNIFTACAILDDKPLHGQGFITQNAKFLADRLGVPFPDLELTDKESNYLSAQVVYGTAASLLRSLGTFGYLEAEGWDPEWCRSMGIATIPSWDEFLGLLKARTKATRDQIKDLGIHPGLFNHGAVTFTIHDEDGMVVGFAARDMNWKPGSTRPKYINTSENCPLYSKSEILYGLHRARRNRMLYIVEGYTDWMALYSCGHTGVVAVGGTALTVHHMRKLVKLGVGRIILALDYDRPRNNGQAPGTAATVRIITEVAPKFPEIQVRVLDWVPMLVAKGDIPKPGEPWEDRHAGVDPRDFVKKHGLDNFLKIDTISAFRWRLQYHQGPDPKDAAEDLVAAIVLEHSAIEQNEMLDDLAEFTGIPKSVLAEEVRRKEVARDRATLDNQDSLKRRFDRQWDAERDTISRLQLIDSLQAGVLGESAAVRVTTPATAAQRIMDIFADQDRLSPELLGWDTGFPSLNGALGEGLPKAEGYVAVAGLPNVGKTSWFAQLVHNLLQKNEAIRIIVMSIDDTLRQFAPKLIAVDSGLLLRSVIHPSRWISEDDRQQLRKSRERLLAWIATGKLEIHDASDGNTTGYIHRLCERTRRTYGGPLLFVLDNFHKLRASRDDRRIHVINASNDLMVLRAQFQMTFLMTVELRKVRDRAERRPRLDDVAESAQLEYDAQCIMIMHQELHLKGPMNTTKFWIDPDCAIDDPNWKESQYKPVTEFFFDKNKISGFKGALGFEFDPSRSTFRERRQEAPKVLGVPFLAKEGVQDI